VHGDICSLCCGTEREVTVDCPHDCPYLQEARKHEHTALSPDEIPNRDVRITEEFLEQHQDLLFGAAKSLGLAAFDTPGAVDSDIRAALDALIRTQLTLQSGVYYESRPENILADHIFIRTQTGLQDFRQAEAEKPGAAPTRDADVLQMLVFLQRLELDRNNRRPRGRAFMDYLRELLESEGIVPPATAASPLIVS
jgi:hypothetical protein